MYGWFWRKRVIIENALRDDAEALSEIHGECFRQAWSDGDFDRFIGDDNYFCLVAREENWVTRRLLGFVVVRRVVDEAEIITIATRPASRGSGVGRKLMEGAMRILAFDRTRKLFLEVDENNPAALSLYRSMRFEQVSERKGYYTGHALGVGKPSTALVMQLELG